MMQQFAAALAEPITLADLWPYALAVVALVFAITLVLRSYYLRQKAQATEELRQQIARDFHDEMGSKLSVINLYSELIRQELHSPSPETQHYLNKIIATSGTLYSAMKGIVWSLQSDSDTLANVVARIEEETHALLTDTPINSRVTFEPGKMKNIVLPIRFKRHLLLIIKEGVHNAFRHAQCQHIHIRIACTHQTLKAIIEDDGIGINPQKIAKGNGLENMQVRARQLGGQLHYHSDATGTRVCFDLPLPG
jgi:signal transduction histidine kinase